MSKKIKAVCNACGFRLTAGSAQIGDTCPWCKRGILTQPSPVKQ